MVWCLIGTAVPVIVIGNVSVLDRMLRLALCLVLGSGWCEVWCEVLWLAVCLVLFWGVCPVLYLGLSELAIRFSGVQWYELIPLCGGGCVGTVSGAVFRAVTCCVMLCDGML